MKSKTQTKKNIKLNKKYPHITKEFKQWLDKFMEEDADILDELANR